MQYIVVTEKNSGARVIVNIDKVERIIESCAITDSKDNRDKEFVRIIFTSGALKEDYIDVKESINEICKEL